MSYPPSQRSGRTIGDYVEQLTYLLFLKMADERTRAPWNQKSAVPEVRLADRPASSTRKG